MNLPQFSVRRRVTVLMIFLAVLVLGGICLKMLGLDLMPELEPPAISVITAYPGASAQDVETKVTKEVEDQLSIVSGLDDIYSSSREGLSVVTCKFAWGANLDEASNDIRSALELAKRTLPDDAEDPIIVKFNTAMFPVAFYGVNAERSWPGIRDLIEDRVTDRLKTVSGVGAAPIFGGPERQINVELDRDRLKAYGLTLDEVAAALRNENLTLPAGDIKIGVMDYAIRTPGEYQSVEEVENIVLRQGRTARCGCGTWPPCGTPSRRTPGS